MAVNRCWHPFFSLTTEEMLKLQRTSESLRGLLEIQLDGPHPEVSDTVEPGRGPGTHISDIFPPDLWSEDHMFWKPQLSTSCSHALSCTDLHSHAPHIFLICIITIYGAGTCQQERWCFQLWASWVNVIPLSAGSDPSIRIALAEGVKLLLKNDGQRRGRSWISCLF